MRSSPALWRCLYVPPTHGWRKTPCTLERLMAYLNYTNNQIQELRIMYVKSHPLHAFGRSTLVS